MLIIKLINFIKTVFVIKRGIKLKMDKVTEISKEQKNDDKILIANVLDKIKIVQKRNIYECTSFLNMREQELIRKILQTRNYTNYEFFGGAEGTERKILFIYSEKIMQYEAEKERIKNAEINCLNIDLPKEEYGKYTHKTYLGAIMKLGVKREMIGDIIVTNQGAQIIIKKDIEKFLMTNISLLTRFKKATIEISELNTLKFIEPKKEIKRIVIPSMRLDAIVSEIARCSRNDASRLLEEERVFVNFQEEISGSKKIKEGDIITIRGKGRFKINKILNETKSKKLAVEIETYIN